MCGGKGFDFNAGQSGTTVTSIVNGITYTSSSGQGGDSGAGGGGSNGLLTIIRRDNNSIMPTITYQSGSVGVSTGTGGNGVGGGVGINSIGQKGFKGSDGETQSITSAIIIIKN
jgi:hypothetical protein